MRVCVCVRVCVRMCVEMLRARVSRCLQGSCSLIFCFFVLRARVSREGLYWDARELLFDFFFVLRARVSRGGLQGSYSLIFCFFYCVLVCLVRVCKGMQGGGFLRVFIFLFFWGG